MKKSILTLLIILTMMPGITSAQDFGKYFVDKTLRIDYIFAGNSQKQMIAVDELNVMPRWYGKRHRLNELPNHGPRPSIRQYNLSQFLLYTLSGMAHLPRSQNADQEFREHLLSTHA